MQADEVDNKNLQAFRFTGDATHPPIVIEAETQAEAIDKFNEYLKQ